MILPDSNVLATATTSRRAHGSPESCNEQTSFERPHHGRCYADMASISDADMAAIHTRVASTPELRAAAYDLVQRRYGWRGYRCPSHERHRAEPEPARPEVTFVSLLGEQALGTLTLVLDGPDGLLAEGTHDCVVDAARKAGDRVCEVTRFAVAQNTQSKPIVWSLFNLANSIARHRHDRTHVFIEVNPRHVPFYSRVLGFAVAAQAKICKRVSAPSVLLALPLDTLDMRLAAGDQRAAAALAKVTS